MAHGCLGFRIVLEQLRASQLLGSGMMIRLERLLCGYSKHMGGCRNHGPFWAPIIVRHLIFRVPIKGP